MRLIILCLVVLLSCDTINQSVTTKSDGIHVDLSNQNISDIPKSVMKNKDNIVALNLSNNNLNKIPSKVYELSNLKTLEINNNNIEFIDNEIIQLKKLKYLNFDGNNLRKLPTNFFMLDSLKLVLYFDNNLTNQEKDSMLCYLPPKSSIFFIKERSENSKYPCNKN